MAKKNREVTPEQLATRALIQQASAALATTFGGVVRPVFVDLGEDVLDPVGSCVLLKIGESHFVVTAGHVVDWREKGPLAVGGLNEIWYLPDHWHLSALPVDREPDKLDFGFTQIVGPLLEKFDAPRWATVEDLDLDPRRPVPAGFFTALGFPTKQQKKNLVDFTFASSTTLWSDLEVRDDVYEKFGRPNGFSRESHILVRFDTTRSVGSAGIRALPDQKGISGGALWRSSLLLGPESVRLVGINLFGSTSGTRVLVGTQIKYVIAGILSAFPDLRPRFPQFRAAELTEAHPAEVAKR